MITLTWGNLRDREFMASLGKLYAQPMGFDLGLNFALLGKEIKKQQKLCDTTHEGILKKFGTADLEKPGVYKLADATREEYAEEMMKLDAHAFELKIPCFDAAKLSEVVKFSPQDLMLLEPLLRPLEAATVAPDVGSGTTPKLAAVPPAPAPAH